MIQECEVKLIIRFDNERSEHPFNWDWPTLLDLAANESVEVVE